MSLLGIILEDNVWTNLPENILRPSVVQVDGKGGVTNYAYERLLKSQLLETEARLRKEGVEQALWSHDLVTEYMEMCVAARILRRMRNYQEIADSLFADANMKLNLFLEGFAGVAEDIGPVAAVEFEDEPGTSEWLPDRKFVYNGFVRMKADE